MVMLLVFLLGLTLLSSLLAYCISRGCTEPREYISASYFAAAAFALPFAIAFAIALGVTFAK